MPLYAAGWWWQQRTHVDREPQLRFPVISVGSLSAGGAGKTPFVMALAEALRRGGVGIDVLSRGHGRLSANDLRVVPEGTADEFGDEPLMMARRLLCPVYVAKERLHAGEMAETDRHVLREDRRLAVHLLDDGFQHRRLPRAVDMVLFTKEDAEDTLLPAGNLREPLRALWRADIVVLRADEAEALRPVLTRVFTQKAMPLVWVVQRRFGFVEGKPSARPLAFCGLARPENFRTALRGAGVEPSAFLTGRDHQRYDDAFVAKLLKRAAAVGADGIVTTAKDAVKLTAAMRNALQRDGPLAVCDVSVVFDDEAGRVAEVLALVEAWWKREARLRSTAGPAV